MVLRMEIPRTTSQALRTLRSARGWKQRQVAQRVGVGTGQRISQWETGNKVPTGVRLSRLAQAYGVPEDALKAPSAFSEHWWNAVVQRLETLRDVGGRVHDGQATNGSTSSHAQRSASL